MTELDKLEEYLDDNGYTYRRTDHDDLLDERGRVYIMERHQIVVYDGAGGVDFDVVCHRGSYGYIDGLLEAAGGIITPRDGDSVAGWLTAKDIINRLRTREKDKAIPGQMELSDIMEEKGNGKEKKEKIAE